MLLPAAAVAMAMTGIASPAWANGGVAMAVDVRNSQKTVQEGSGGACTWEVASDVVVVNLRDTPQRIDAVSYSVSWTGPNDRSGVVTDITVLDNGGLQPGLVLAPNEERTFSPVVVRFAIPCDATFGDLMVRLTSPEGTGSGDAPFLEGGTAVPPAAVGALGVAAVLGIFLRDRRHRRASRTGNERGVRPAAL